MNARNLTLPASTTGLPAFRLGTWTVQPPSNTLEQDGRTVPVEPRIMHVLVCLAGHPGEVISRDLLLDTVWAGAVVQEEALTHAISQLRRIMGDDARAPRIIETIRKGGYRLLVQPEPMEQASTAPPETPGRGRRPLLLTLCGLVVLSVALTLWLTGGPSPNRPRFPSAIVLDGRPFTSMPGYEIHPAISPDGGTVAFTRWLEDEQAYKIFLKQPGSERMLRLTEGPEWELYPAWSPDETRLAFVSGQRGQRRICVVPVQGGPPIAISATYETIDGIDWSPDGKTIAMAVTHDPEVATRLVELVLETKEERLLTDPDPLIVGDRLPRYAPDGEVVAFVRADHGRFMDIFSVERGGPGPQRVTRDLVDVRGLCWERHGHGLVYAAVADQVPDLWYLDLDGDTPPTRLATRGGVPLYPSLARSSDRLVYQDRTLFSEIWSSEPTAGDSTAAAFITSTRRDFGAAIAPSGDAFVFVSDRSGHRELWLGDRRGQQLRQLTDLGHDRLGGARWSPDGARISFRAAPQGFLQLFVVNVAGGEVTQLTHDDAHHRLANWSPDSRRVYCSVEDGPVWKFWTVEAQGGPKQPVETRGCLPLHESPDGWLYYHKMEAPGVWRMRLPAGEEQGVATADQLTGHRGIVVTDDGVYFCREVDGEAELVFLAHGDGVEVVLDRIPSGAGGHLTVAPDGSWFLYDHQQYLGEDLIMAEGWWPGS